VKLKSITKINQIKAAYKRLGISVASKQLPIAVSFKTGFFLTDIYVDGTVNVSDGTGVADAFIISLTQKQITDVANTVEVISKAFGRGFADSYTVADNDVLLVGKSFSDPTNITDALGFQQITLFDDIVGVTDDIDGAASILDDQEMQFVKNTTNVSQLTDSFTRIVAFNRTFTDPASMTDDESRSLGKNITELPSLTDTGLVRSQSYCDFSFIAGDYVGTSQTF